MNRLPGLVSVSIVAYNSGGQLESCLGALRAQSYRELEVIVVDNASTDDSVAKVRELVPGATIVRNPSNIGFGAAHNIVFRVARGEFILLLNPDVQLSPAFVERLVKAAQQDPRIGTCCGKLLLDAGTAGAEKAAESLIDSTGLFVGRTRRQYLRGHRQVDRGQFDQPGFVFGACGAAPLYRRTMIEDVSIDGEFFDSDFFMHKEDLDASWRAQLFGWRCCYVPSAVAFHARSFRPGERLDVDLVLRVHAVKNRYLAMLKNEHLVNFLLHLPWVLGYDLGIIAYLLVRERSSLRAFPELFRLVPRALRKRATVMARKRVSAGEIRRFIK